MRVDRAHSTSSLGAVCGRGPDILAVFVDLLPWSAVLGAAFVGGLGLPRWVVALQESGRVKQFLDEFANALDVIVRGVKSGLPLNDGIRLIASEAPQPVQTEFRRSSKRSRSAFPFRRPSSA